MGKPLVSHRIQQETVRLLKEKWKRLWFFAAPTRDLVEPGQHDIEYVELHTSDVTGPEIRIKVKDDSAAWTLGRASLDPVMLQDLGNGYALLLTADAVIILDAN